jgi:hypothetical protein
MPLLFPIGPRLQSFFETGPEEETTEGLSQYVRDEIHELIDAIANRIGVEKGILTKKLDEVRVSINDRLLCLPANVEKELLDMLALNEDEAPSIPDLCADIDAHKKVEKRMSDDDPYAELRGRSIDHLSKMSEQHAHENDAAGELYFVTWWSDLLLRDRVGRGEGRKSVIAWLAELQAEFPVVDE